MNELEFEEKINEILTSEINNEELFNNDFNTFYTKILNHLNISNINELMSKFNEEEMKNYHTFYTSLENLYILLYGFYQVINKNIDNVLEDILNKGLKIDDYFRNVLGQLINKDLDNIDDFMLLEHQELLEMLEERLKKYYNLVRKSIVRIINDRKYLLNNVSNINFTDYLKNDTLTNMDIDLLNLYLDKERYDILYNVTNDVFNQLSREQIFKILKNSDWQ